MSSHLNGSAKVVENFEVRNGGEVKCGTGVDWPEQKEGAGEKGAWGSAEKRVVVAEILRAGEGGMRKREFLCDE